MLTSITLVKNEENNIKNVLRSLSWIDEKIVVDNGSKDKTVKAAKDWGATVISIPEMNFSLMRNKAAERAKHDWILYLDTDEEVSFELKKEIISISKTVPNSSDIHAYRIRRKNFYMKHPWPHSDGMIRLIYKPALEGWFGDLHETAKIKGNTDTLKNELIHKTHNTLEDMLIQTNDWSDIEADLRLKSHHPPVVSWRLLRVMWTGFYESYIKQGGWKVGTIGIIESIYQGFSLFITYAKLWEKQQIKKKL